MELENALIDIIEETYNNVCEEGTHKYKKLKEKDFKKIASRVIEDDEFWNTLDYITLEILSEYEYKKGV